MKRTHPARSVCAWLALGTLWLAGCEDHLNLKIDRTRFFAPNKVVKAPARPSVHPILPSLSPADPTTEILPNAVPPGAEDWSYTDGDYRVGPTDVVDVSILDLFSDGLETVLRREVSASGYIDLPQLTRRVRAAGLTKEQLKDAIRRAYIDDDVLQDPTVSVTLAARRQNTFSILGAIGRPGTYSVSRKDMRLLDALALAGDVTQTNIRYVYLIRPAPAIRKRSEERKLPPRRADAEPGDADVPTDLPDLPKLEDEKGPGEQKEKRGQAPFRPLGPQGASHEKVPVPFSQFLYADGRWVRAEAGTQPATRPAARLSPPKSAAGPRRGLERPSHADDPFGWRKYDRSTLGRVIAIDLARLTSGDPRMNVVIRSNDIIHVPPLEVGEFYVMGEVARPGVYSLTGRRITVKQALAAAGNLGPLAWPENSALIRRLGPDQEQVIPLNVEAICRGEEPDLFLKPDDVLAIGTDVRAPFAAVVRNAFRMTYGFGFIYDRNFADPILGHTDSKRFTRW